MRVAFLGKGGSGKTTLASLFAFYLIRQGKKLLSIDADVNVHLGQALGVTSTPKFLSQHHREVFDYLEGKNPFFRDISFFPELGSIPPTATSRLLSLSPEDELLNRLGVWNGNHVHLAVGNYDPVDLGRACYHYKLNVLQLLLHHLNERPDEFVVADTTAGVDNVGTSLFMAYDLNVFCVEPTLKSVAVAKEFLSLISAHHIPVRIVCNKIETRQDREFIERSFPDELVLGEIDYESVFQTAEQGATPDLSPVINKYAPLFDKIIQEIVRAHRPREQYLNKLREVYLAECRSWWNDYYHFDLTQLLDTPTAGRSEADTANQTLGGV